MKSKHCLIKGCPNKSDGGLFVGDLCKPCYEALCAGKIPKSEGNYLRVEIEELNKKINKLTAAQKTNANDHLEYADIVLESTQRSLTSLSVATKELESPLIQSMPKILLMEFLQTHAAQIFKARKAMYKTEDKKNE